MIPSLTLLMIRPRTISCCFDVSLLVRCQLGSLLYGGSTNGCNGETLSRVSCDGVLLSRVWWIDGGLGWDGYSWGGSRKEIDKISVSKYQFQSISFNQLIANLDPHISLPCQVSLCLSLISWRPIAYGRSFWPGRYYLSVSNPATKIVPSSGHAPTQQTSSQQAKESNQPPPSTLLFIMQK